MKRGDNHTERALDQLAISELLTLGEGEIAYIRKLDAKAIADLPLDIDMTHAWGIYSARGETLALCDSPASAWSFFADHSLEAVSLH